ncbi:MAG: DUF3307 domain-containing protein [Elusimicrobiota bacterium]
MLIFWRLILGHFLADFTLQSNRINELKRDNTVGMLLHCLTHPFCYIILTYPYLSEVWVRILGIPIHGWTAIVLITTIHYVEDIWRVHNIRKLGLPDNTLYLLWDQVIHISTIFVFFGDCPISSEWQSLVPEVWPVLATLAIVATHFSVVLVYFIEKDFFNKSYPGGWEKYISITERGLAFTALAALPGMRLAWMTAIAALLAPRFVAAHYHRTQNRPLSLSWTIGSLLAISAGLLARSLLI